MESRPDSLQTVVVFWNRIRVGQVSLPKLGGGCGRLLISPQGTRPGVLYSAIKAASAERCLAVCSPLSERSVEEAASRADFTGSIAKLVVQDAHGGYNEVAPSVTKARAWLLEVDEIVANLTGGTTMMSVLVQQLVEAAVRLDRRCRRFVLIDRRPPGEQDAHPFVPSEHNWLGVAEGDCYAHD